MQVIQLGPDMAPTVATMKPMRATIEPAQFAGLPPCLWCSLRWSGAAYSTQLVDDAGGLPELVRGAVGYPQRGESSNDPTLIGRRRGPTDHCVSHSRPRGPTRQNSIPTTQVLPATGPLVESGNPPGWDPLPCPGHPTRIASRRPVLRYDGPNGWANALRWVRTTAAIPTPTKACTIPVTRRPTVLTTRRRATVMTSMRTVAVINPPVTSAPVSPIPARSIQVRLDATLTRMAARIG